MSKDKKPAPRQPSGPSQSSGQRSSAAQRLAAERSAAARERVAATQRRRQAIIALSGILVIVVAVAVLVVVKVATGAGGAKSGQKATAAASSVITDVTTVPASVLNTIGVGTATSSPTALKTAAALTANGLPRVLYVGAEYCPYCATERWAMVVALSRFGTFTNLGQTASSPSDVYPSTATLTFHGATFTSQYLSFTGKEIESNQVSGSGYAALDTLDATDQSLLSTYDAPPYFQSSGGIPFIDIGNKYLLNGASYDPTVLQKKTHQQIAAALSDPTSAIAKGADGAANLITAAICSITNNQPSTVCSSTGVTTAKAALTSAN